MCIFVPEMNLLLDSDVARTLGERALHRWAPNTIKNYSYKIKFVRHTLESVNHNPPVIQNVDLAFFLNMTDTNAIASSGWRTLVNAIKCYGILNQVQFDELLLNVMLGNARQSIRPWNPVLLRKTLTMEEVKDVILKLLGAEESITKYQSIFVLLAGFALGARFRDSSDFKGSSIKFEDDGLIVYFQTRKNVSNFY